jgi:DNA replication and repair protein RecF
LNYIIGGNGQGKTTILEAIYYLCTTKNLNQNSDYEAVSFGEKDFSLFGKFNDLTEYKTKIQFDAELNKKNFFINDKQVTRSASIIGKFPVVSLTPLDHAITQGSPADRRKFVDSVISQLSPAYLEILLEYNKVLRQRSALLYQIRERREKSLLNQLDAWTEILINNGTEIVKHRMTFAYEFNNFIKENYLKISDQNEIPSLEYNFYSSDTEDEIRKNFTDKLTENYEDEIIRAQNLVGPHRDDFVFCLNQKEIKKYGSQGQHKTFQIALRFSQFFYMYQVTGKKPIFLMDDIFGDLDSQRVKKIGEYLKSIGQAFITLTDFNHNENIFKSANDKFIFVSRGKVSYA